MTRRAIGRWIPVMVAGVVVPLDWITKVWVHRSFDLGETRTVIDGLFNLVYVRNFGSAFGLFNQGRETSFNTWFFIIASVVGLALLLYLITHEPAHHRVALFCLGLLLGGLIGNQGERLLHGYVTDFLDVYWTHRHWPAFNIADSAISVGIVGYMLASFRREKN